ncbi:hypothetical protein EYC80_006460 [Monilinia laxa]|uniref:Uncharacterized protein n=1 Tax=Monilinia laxa TaxID=61186 RepID=A0A5N6JUV6_MONLA|nr:hypothetical protein EYC80_006460 [Monilinia laxa]
MTGKVPEYQLAKYVFKTHEWQITKPSALPNDSTFINALVPSPEAFIEVVKSMNAKGIDPCRESSKLTPRESSIENETANIQRYLVVGVTFVDLTEITLKKSPDTDTGSAVGTEASDETKVAMTDLASPYLVVTPGLSGDINDATNQTNMYGLVSEIPGGLCLPTIVSQDRVFYLARYSNDSSTMNSRNSSWNERVLVEVMRNLSSAASQQNRNFT